MRYDFPIDIKYGITDFIEAGMNISYSRAGMPSKTTSYIGSNYIVQYYSLEELRGLNDLLIYASLRLPIEYKFFDINFGGGIFLPSAKYKPDQPKHSITSIEHILPDGSIFEHSVNYRYHIPNGSGVPMYRLSSSGKLKVDKISFQLDAVFQFPAKTGNNIRWSHTLLTFDSGDEFSYTSEEYEYLPDRAHRVDLAIHYQVNGWLDLFLNGANFSSSGGWLENWGQKYANSQQTLWTIEPGFSIQVSPKLILFQKTCFPLSGKNIDGQFGIMITARFNLFLI